MEEELFTLQLLHAADQEAGLPAVEDAVNFSAVIEGLADDFENTLRLSSGDAYIPGPFFRASEEIYGQAGVGDILINNALGFSAITFGNHEFDQGTELVSNLIAPNPEITGPGIGEGGYPGTAFPYLSANLDFSTSVLSDLVVEAQSSPQPNTITDSVVIDVNGESIGVVGATTPTLENISSPEDVGVLPPDDSTEELAAIIQEEVDALTEAGINKIILSAHFQQIAIEQEVAALLDDVDIVIAGGSNTLLANDDDPLRAEDESEGPYPIEVDSDGETVFVVNTDGNYRYVGQLVADFDSNGVITNIGEASGAFATDEAGVDRVFGEDVNPAEVADPTVVEVTGAIAELTLEADGNVFGLTEVFLNGTRNDVRTQETNLGNLTADANLFYADFFDDSVTISLKNGGGIRDDIGSAIVPPGGTSDELELLPPQANPAADKEEGEISQLDIENSLSFNNALSLLTVTASELEQIIEHGVAATAPGATPGQFPQVGGLNFTFDPSLTPIEFEEDSDGNITGVATEGQRVRSLEILDGEGNVVDTVVENGDLVGDPNREIRLVTLGFLADGGDGYPFPAFGENRVDLVEQPIPEAAPNEATFADSGTEQDALAEFLAVNFPADDNPDTPAFTSEDTPPEEDTRIFEAEVGSTIEGTDEDDALFASGVGDEVAGLGGDDTLDAASFDGVTLDGGAGADELIAADTNGATLIGGEGNDEAIAGQNGTISGDGGNDTLDGTAGGGSNSISGGEGDDDLFAGGNDTLVGGVGSDRLFVGETGNNTFTGDGGDDQFWIALAEVPTSPSTITDFVQDEDELGIDLAGVVESFADLEISQSEGNTVISIPGGEDLAILPGFEGELVATDFFFVGEPLALSNSGSTTEDEAVEIPDLLANDIDTSDPPESINLFAVAGSIGNFDRATVLPSGASISVSASGDASYDPNGAFESLTAGESATDSFTYTISDTSGEVDRTRVVVSIEGVNDAPVAADDFSSTVREIPVAIEVLANDSDVDGELDPSSVAIGTTASNGTVSTDPNTGVVTYTPNSGFVGDDSFTYTVSDGAGLTSSVATVSVSVSEDELPITQDDTATTLEDQAVAIAILDNDTDPNGDLDPSSVAITSDPSNGSLDVDAETGEVSYTPNADFFGEDSFTYTVSDEAGNVSGDNTVTITVESVNDEPSFTLGGDQFNQENEGAVAVEAFASDISAGPANESEQSLFFDISTDNDGLFAIAPDIDVETGELTYALAEDTNGAATVSVALVDNGGTENGGIDRSTTQTFAINVAVGQNEPPVVEAAEFTIAEDIAEGAVVGTVTASDDEDSQLSFALESVDPDGDGVAAFVIDESTGEITVGDGDDIDFEAASSFTLEATATDSEGLSGTGDITINVENVNEAPEIDDVTFDPLDVATVANGDGVGTIEASDPDVDDVLTFAITAGNDPDGDGTPAFAISDAGEITVANAGAISDSFTLTVTVTDAGGLSDTASAIIPVDTEENDAPVVEDASFTTDENSEAGTPVGTVAATDPDGDELTFAIDEGNEDPDGDGVAAFAIDPGTGEITVADSDDLDFETTPSFVLAVSATDPDGLSDTGEITINLNDVPDGVLPNLQLLDNNVFSLGGAASNLLLANLGVQTANLNEIGIFVVDDTNGNIGDLAPTDEGYIQQILENGATIFSALPNQGDEVLELSEQFDRILASVNPDDLVAFYFIENASSDGILNGEFGEDSVSLGFATNEVMTVEELQQGQFQLSFAGEQLATRFESTEAEAPLGNVLQIDSEVIDLRSVEGDVTATLGLGGVNAIADFDNLIGLYPIDNPQGAVGDLSPGDEGYARAALEGAVEDFLLRGGSAGNTSAEEFDSTTLAGGAIYAPFIIANGGSLQSVAEFIEANPDNTAAEDPSDLVAYFPFVGANPDSVDHLRLLGDNAFGFEDLPGGGDRDFNDSVFEINLTV